MSSRHSTTTGYGNESNCILALVEGRGQARGEVGMACLDLGTPHLVLCQFTDTQTYTKVITKLNIFRPVEVLMLSSSCDVSGQPSRLFVQIKKEFPETPIIPLQRRLFNEGKGLQRIQNLVVDKYSSVIHTVTQKYYSLSATAALLKYLELVRSVVFTPNSLKIEFQGSEKTVMIDSATAQHLELLQNNHIPNSSQSLLGILNNCRTPGGARLLRMNILQPPCDIQLITTRLDCIQELKENTEILYGLMSALSQLPQDMEHVIAALIQVPKTDNDRALEQHINNIIFLKQTLTILPSFVSVLEPAEHDFFCKVRENFSSPVFKTLLDRIQSVINEEVKLTKGSTAMRMQRSFAVKPDINPILDVARRAYCEIQDDVNQYVRDLGTEHNLHLRLLESSVRGFYIQFLLPGRVWELPNLPSSFLFVKKHRNVVTFSTETLLTSDQRIRAILKEIQGISGIVISQLVSTIREDMGSIYTISEAVAELDVLYSLANYSLSTLHVVRPQFSTQYTAITMGRHPILDGIAHDPPVPNNIFMSESTNVAVITGPNMSGKTTLLKQVATLQVLAQIGSFVPAETATFRLINRIFSRIGTGDSIEGSASSFALEMAEMNYILKNVNDYSLVIIDELGRATSIEEGTAISWAMTEALMEHRAFTLIATHFLFLTKLESLYMNVLNYKLETQEVNPTLDEDGGSSARRRLALTDQSQQSQSQPETHCRLKYTHVFKRGVTDLEFYGLKLTRNSSFPPRVVQKAMTLAKNIMDNRRKQTRQATEEPKPTRRARYLLAVQIYMAAKGSSTTDPAVTRDYLKSLQEEFRKEFL